MLNRFFMIVLFVLLAVAACAQDTSNRTDEKGRKQGFWRKTDAAGLKVYEGQFRDGVPQGEFRYFYPDGKLKTVSVITGQGTRARTVSYFKNGKMMASGNYLDEKKDSIWRFYNEKDGNLVSEENYTRGVKNGKSSAFYPDGRVSEWMTWENGQLTGPWEQLYSDGKPKLRAGYKQNEKHGSFTTYYLSGQVMMSGSYDSGHMDGTWIYYDEKGIVTKKEYYSKGVLLKKEEKDPGTAGTLR